VACQKVNLPRSSLPEYLKHGVPKFSLPNLPKSTLPRVKNCQVLLAGVNRYPSRPPAKKSQPSQRMVFGPVLAGSSPSPHLTLSSRQPGRRAGFLEDLNRPAEAVIGGDSYKIILNLKKVLCHFI
jgi:hypothetical protein